MPVPPLLGFTIGVTADRRAEEQARLLARRGGRVLLGAVMTSTVNEGDGDLQAATRALIGDPPDVVLLTTGVGTRTWFAEAEAAGRGEPLRRALGCGETWARGPKASGAAVSAGLEVTWRAPTECSQDLVDRLAAKADPGRLRVAVQLDGHEAQHLVGAVAALGCEVVPVRPYRWGLPDDTRPARALIDAACRGGLDAVTFTSAPAVHNLVELARRSGLAERLAEALNGPVAAACVGPVSAQACRDHGIAAVEPRRARTVAMVDALCEHLATRRIDLTVAGHRLVLSGSVALVDGAAVDLGPRERRLLGALAERPGAVLSKPALLARAWPGEGVDPHAVEAGVARLRRRLGPAGAVIETVVRRGYRLRTG